MVYFSHLSLSISGSELRSLLRLAFPILLAQLALTALGVVDTLMSAQVSVDDLAAIGLGSSLLMPVFMLGTGILLALTPKVAKALAQQKDHAVSQLALQGLWLAVPLGVLSLIILWNLTPLLDQLSLAPLVYQRTEDYLFYIAFGLLGISLYQALRFTWEGLGETLPTMMISVGALLLNIPLNWIFIYGWGPIPAFGAAGCGIASAIVMWVMLLWGVLYLWRSPKMQALRRHWYWQGPQWRNVHHTACLDLLKLGVPITATLWFEVGLFSFIAVFIAPLGTEVLAAHQVAISFTSLAFMLPLSLAMALTIRIGAAYGEGSLAVMRLRLQTGISLALGLGMGLALFTYFAMGQIVQAYTENEAVQALALTLLLFAAAYQVFDALQVSIAGALRGLQDTKMALIVAFISYWLIGLGVGWILCFTAWLTVEPMGVAGFWLGIFLGLTLAAGLLLWHLRRLLKQLVQKGELA